MFLILVASTKKLYSSFLKKVFVFQKICFKDKILKTLETFTDCHIKHADLWNGELFWKSLVPFFRRTYALSVGFKMKTLSFLMLRQKPPQVLPQKSLKEANIHFYCLFDELRFSDICTIMELKELNWLCKHMKIVRSNQPCISMKFYTELMCKFLHVNIVNTVVSLSGAAIWKKYLEYRCS